ncbi:hypothetical protein BDZ97DRAFT_1840620 [Flammula alnicola]|nr:hypothetical protein BDZ97DRAFT_1840620 [Flammula alnicola]
MGMAMMGLMHIYFHFTQPPFTQALTGVKDVCDAKPVTIHLLAATGPQTDAAAIAEAEKRVGKKEWSCPVRPLAMYILEYKYH